MKRTIAVVTSSRADYSHLYWPLHDLAQHPDVELKLIVLGAHLAPQFGETVKEIEKDGFPIAARLECLLSSDTDVGMAKTLGVAVLGRHPEVALDGPCDAVGELVVKDRLLAAQFGEQIVGKTVPPQGGIRQVDRSRRWHLLFRSSRARLPVLALLALL